MFTLPNFAELKVAAGRLGLALSDAELAAIREGMAPLAETYAALDSLDDSYGPLRYPRTALPPAASDDPAFAARAELRGAATGPLAGRRIAVKDSIAVAGVPMRNGGALADGFVPDFDATVVTRILDAGGIIAGKAACEFACVSGGSHTGLPSPLENPRKPGRTAGGSSSGSAVLVAAGAVDMALGCDQGGSIRIPSSYCGIVGLKPTFGLVPYTGILGLEMSIDHCGPMTATVADNALLLEAIAGPDGLDPRQPSVPPAGGYVDALGKGAAGLRIGVLREGFGSAGSDPAVDAMVQSGAERLAHLGADVAEISVPWHVHGTAIWSPLTHDGGFLSTWIANGLGLGAEGARSSDLAAASAVWRERPDLLAPTVKIMLLFGQTSFDRDHGRYYAKAQNLRPRLRAAYDDVFRHVDLLLMPTMPTTAGLLPPPGADMLTSVRAAWPMAANLCPFNATGHPALSLPCGTIDGLPVGLMLVAKAFDEAAIYRAARAFEAAGDRTMP